MFTENPSNNQSYANRSLVHGVGINDVDYITNPEAGNAKATCPFYRVWSVMINRCYSKKFHERHPTYKDCTVCDEWLFLSKFKVWMEKQDWQGNDLDKDILSQGNKIYSPKNCIFVAHRVNTLFNSCGRSRGKLPQGVHLRRSGKYEVRCHKEGKRVYLGTYDTPELAFAVYKDFKYKVIAEIAEDQIEPLRSALLNYKII